MGERIDLFLDYASLPFEINFNKTRSDAYGKTVQVLLLYLLTQKGEDELYPELGINFSVFNEDPFVARNEFMMLADNLRSYGYDVEFVDYEVKNGVARTYWRIEGEVQPISFKIGDIIPV